MSWILDHLNIVIVGVLVLGSFLKSRFEALKQDAQEPEEFPEVDSHEESRRHRPPLMPYVPPPVERTPSAAAPAQQSPELQPVFAATRSQSGAMTASADEAAAVLQNQRDIEERLRMIRAARPAKGSPKSPVQTRSHKPASVTACVTSSIRGQLRNPAELRRAIVLREILDRPVGLR